MKYAYIEDGVVIEVSQVNPFTIFNSDYASRFVEVPTNVEVGWTTDGIGFKPPESNPPQSQFDIDKIRYKKRSSVKDDLISYMAADNMSRVRSGEWTVQDLSVLLSDPAVVAANTYMSTLSFELAAQEIRKTTTPLLTTEIKDSWISKLEQHYYLEG